LQAHFLVGARINSEAVLGVRCVVPGVSAAVAVAVAAWLGRALAVGARKLLGGLDVRPCSIVCRSVWVDPLAEHRRYPYLTLVLL